MGLIAPARTAAAGPIQPAASSERCASTLQTVNRSETEKMQMLDFSKLCYSSVICL